MGNFAKEEKTTIVKFFGDPSPVFGFVFDTMDDREGGVFCLVVARMALETLEKTVFDFRRLDHLVSLASIRCVQ